jgi:3-hydroxyisobutyrate dehydrogenase-like beta-hydroxyacid dehydrogenase
MQSAIQRIGVIGLGHMGSDFAGNLILPIADITGLAANSALRESRWLAAEEAETCPQRCLN